MSKLSEVLRSKLIPWAQQDAARRFIVGRTEMRRRDLPEGVKLVRRKTAGKRIVVKNRRRYNNTRNIIAEWPEDGQYELGKYVLICVLDGFIDYPLGRYRLQCGPGHFIFIPPGLPHSNGSRSFVDLKKNDSCDLMIFLLHPNALECWNSHGHSQGRDLDNYHLVLHHRVVALLKALVEEVMEDEERALSIGEGLLLSFLQLLQREADAGRVQRVRTLPLGRQHAIAASASDDFATQLEHYVQARLRQPLTLQVVSRDMYLSPAQFARNVRRETGETFNQLLARHRLEEAKNLLRNSQWTISAIADLVGLRSSSYFCTFFKTHTGETPSGFRERSKDTSSSAEN
jgi:AraC-like DNA-binding protein